MGKRAELVESYRRFLFGKYVQVHMYLYNTYIHTYPSLRTKTPGFWSFSSAQRGPKGGLT